MAIITEFLVLIPARIFHADTYTFFRANGKIFPLRPGQEILYFDCPFCGYKKRHMHGSPGADFVGRVVTRGSHCQKAIDAGCSEYALLITKVVHS
jgi:hypothetical protein